MREGKMGVMSNHILNRFPVYACNTLNSLILEQPHEYR
jgi:hypothetical protein